MIPADALVGYWINDLFYEFENNDDVKKCKRRYPVSSPNIDNALRKCASLNPDDAWVKNYFMAASIEPFTGTGFRINGRNYYTILGDGYPEPSLISTVTKPPSPECTLRQIYGKYEGVWFDISYLICSSMRSGDSSIASTLQKLEACPPAPLNISIKGCDSCTDVGHRVSTSLIKIAAQRIFADPEQSIIELPVNSLDAYSPDTRIGKFGLGFFSILYWLIGHPKRSLTITSFYRARSSTTSSIPENVGTVCTYTTTIQEVNGVLAFFLSFPESSITMTGTYMYLDAHEDPFDARTIKKMDEQLGKLVYTKSSRIAGKLSSSRYFKNGALHSNRNLIYISIGSEGLVNEDYATGIPFEVYVNVLLQPSVSTKTITAGGRLIPTFINNSRVDASSDGYNSHFLIVVGNVVVVDIPTKASLETPYTYIVDMPLNTPLPVSRDDIILTPSSRPVFIEGLSMVLEGITKNRSANFATLQSLLQTYKDYTASDVMRLTIDETVNSFIQRNVRRLVPADFLTTYKSISPVFIASNVYSIDALSQTIEDEINKPRTDITVLNNIFYGKKVVIIDEADYSIANAHLPNYLFIEKYYYDSLSKDVDGSGKPAWIATVVSAFQANEALYPVNTSYGATANDENLKVIQQAALVMGSSIDAVRGPGSSSAQSLIPPQVRTKLLALLSRFDALQVYFNISPESKDNLVYEALVYNVVLGERAFQILTDALLKLFATFKGSQTYGMGQNKLSILTNDMVGSETADLSKHFNSVWKRVARRDGLKTMIHIDVDKLRLYSTQWQTLAFGAVDETPYTVIQMFGEYNPLVVILDAFTEKLPTITNGRTAKQIHDIYNGRRCGKCIIFLTELLDQSNDYIEFSYVVVALVNRLTSLLSNLREESIPRLVAHILNYIRVNRYASNSSVLLKRWLPLTLNTTITDFRPTLIYNDAKLWVAYNTLSAPLKISTPLPSIDNGYTFTTNTYIQYAFVNGFGEETSPRALNTLFKSIEGFTPSAAIEKPQLVEIAVNEGTTKPFIDAMMTELTQNSIDAIRETSLVRKVDPTINLNLKTTEARDKLIFTITDFVGLTAKAFLYIGFPFLSTKSPSELVTGEMGSGFFNVYRESESVDIYSQSIDDTDGSGVVYMSHDVPLRDSTGRVIDIRRTMRVSSSKSDPKAGRYTTIQVIMGVKSENDLIDKASKFAYVAEKVLALSLQSKIVYNELLVSIPRNLASSNKHFELYADISKNASYNSYLLTKGIPFQPLDGYARNEGNLLPNSVELLMTDITLNVVHGAYTPVQTRTRINLAPDVEASFTEMMYNAVFLRALSELALRNKSDSIFPNLSSRAEAAQIKFTHYANIPYFSPSGIFLYHKYNNQRPIYSVVNELIDKIDGKKGDSAQAVSIIEKELAQIYPSAASYGNITIRSAIMLWFENKNPPAVKKSKSPVTAKKSAKKKKNSSVVAMTLTTDQRTLEKYLQILVNVYWTIGKNMHIKGMSNNDAPQLKFHDFSEENEAISGVYNSGIHELWLNVDRFTPKETKMINSALSSNNPDEILGMSNKSQLWKSFFSYRFPSSTLYHELEHARRRSAHADAGGHDVITGSLFPGDVPKPRTFDDSANAVFNLILQQGYYDTVLKDIAAM